MARQTKNKVNNLWLAVILLWTLTLIFPQGVLSQEGTPAPEQITETPPTAEPTPQKAEKRGFWGKRSKKNKDNTAPELNHPSAGTLPSETDPVVEETAPAPELHHDTPAAAEPVNAVITENTADSPMQETHAILEETVAETVPTEDGQPAAETAPSAEMEASAETPVADALPAGEKSVAETVPAADTQPVAETFVQNVNPAAVDKNTDVLQEIEQATKANQKEMQALAKDFRLRMNAAKTQQERLALKEEMISEQNRKAAEFQKTIDALKAVLK